ncbi:hypothetical protein CAP39_13250 [Sphingomonas sp. IBVSS1]|nr:hypothetical protein CAP39_13250 [Sphingomonas sp. IBVSS1]
MTGGQQARGQGMINIGRSVAIAVLLGAAPALAAPVNGIVEQLTMSTRISFTKPDFSSSQIIRTAADPPFSQQLGVAGTPAVLSMDLTATLGPNGSFFFLHNLYALGTGAASMETILDITLTNTGSETAFLRFDSMITPGHIAFQGSNGFHSVEFGFRVEQFATGSVTSATPRLAELYSARGSLTSAGPNSSSIRTSDNRQFANFTDYRAQGRTAFDWSSTPLNLNLMPIAAGATHTLRYTNQTFVSGHAGLCLTLLGCEGVQVAFGDPRNDGSVSMSAPFGAAALSAQSASLGDQPLIGRRFGALASGLARVVDQAAPLPVIDVPPVDANYAWLPRVDGSVAAVPEPSAWLLLIAGFGLIGNQQRRQRQRAVG